MLVINSGQRAEDGCDIHPVHQSTRGRFLKGRESYSKKLPAQCSARKRGLWTHYFNLKRCRSLSMGSLISPKSFQAHS